MKKLEPHRNNDESIIIAVGSHICSMFENGQKVSFWCKKQNVGELPMNIENVLILVCKLIQSNGTFLVIFKHCFRL